MIRLIWIIGILLILSHWAASQCDHDSIRISRFEAERIQPIVARNYDGLHLEYTIADDRATNAGTFLVTKQASLPDDFSANYKGRLYWVVYSICDQQAELITPMSAEQEKAFRKFNPK